MSDFQQRLLAAQDLAARVRTTGQRLRINADATITLYHSTSQDNASAIVRDGQLKGNTWLGASRAATLVHVRAKHGSSIATLALKVAPEQIEFSTGTGEFYAPFGLIRDAHGLWQDLAAQRRDYVQNQQPHEPPDAQPHPTPSA